MRHEQWETRLSNALDEARFVPFAWGGHDCFVVNAVKCVEAVTGRESPCAHLVATYGDEAEADMVLASEGVCDVDGLLAKYFPRVVDPDTGEIAVQRAERGDLGVVEVSGHKIIVTVCGSHCSAPGARCENKIPRTRLIASFRVV